MRSTIILLATVFIICSCEKIIPIDLSLDERRIVINSFFNNDELFHANISFNQAANDGDTVYYVDNAIVTLYQNDAVLDVLTHDVSGNYYSNNVVPGVGVPYKLTVDVPGITPATTEYTEIPPAVQSFTLDTSSYTDISSGDGIRQVTLKFKDIENTTNYYMLYMTWVATCYEYDTTGTIIDSVKVQTTYGGGAGINIPPWGSGKVMFTDEFFEGDTIEKHLYFREDMYGAGFECTDNLMAYFKLCTITEEYYLYGKSYAEQNAAIDYSMFVEPVPVYTNINDGYGIFAGYGQCIDSVFYGN